MVKFTSNFVSWFDVLLLSFGILNDPFCRSYNIVFLLLVFDVIDDSESFLPLNDRLTYTQSIKTIRKRLTAFIVLLFNISTVGAFLTGGAAYFAGMFLLTPSLIFDFGLRLPLSVFFYASSSLILLSFAHMYLLKHRIITLRACKRTSSLIFSKWLILTSILSFLRAQY
jgi:hypothetical protein